MVTLVQCPTPTTGTPSSLKTGTALSSPTSGEAVAELARHTHTVFSSPSARSPENSRVGQVLAAAVELKQGEMRQHFKQSLAWLHRPGPSDVLRITLQREPRSLRCNPTAVRQWKDGNSHTSAHRGSPLAVIPASCWSFSWQ